ncbi:hypothetical protein CW676_11775 [Macrococcoides caseolyticum]|uniref:hypothetical protein n=1 Tax=Macrococcoides caseolyticum TaxID=69966 RepID=UPI000C322A8D|nr:hypothetical protein [Macrococcus caseolyticus]PKE05767.1 hypothetical protein CW692_11750 [Macrococcus caseolyticus]PKE22971.1 hypothetical protein CW689_11630 [Macrococcus caseolyticus]PKE51933.1 hypothetical protein CW676_11775 [Macrococcus caseolyticus]PKF37479.1 hypothetical protein CW681_11875 [Macrococcus caseolyticus]
MNIIGLIIVTIFVFIWTFITKKFLPNELVEGNNKKFDERETKILLEVFSNTFVWLVYAMLLSLILKLSGLSNFDKAWFPNMPEIYYIILTICIFTFNYFYIKTKYTVKG